MAVLRAVATAVVVGGFVGVLLNAAPAAGVLADPPEFAAAFAAEISDPAGAGRTPAQALRAADAAAKAAMTSRYDEGTITLIAHADAAGIYWPAPDANVRLTAAHVADLLHGRTEFRTWLGRSSRADGELVVCACSLGLGNEIRLLADAVGLPATAPDAAALVFPAAGARPAYVETLGGWVRAVPGEFAGYVAPPVALTDRSAPSSLRLGPSGRSVTVPPGALPVRAGRMSRRAPNSAAASRSSTRSLLSGVRLTAPEFRSSYPRAEHARRSAPPASTTSPRK
jgi:hypothetical protein